LPGVAYPGFRDNRSTLNTKTGFKKKSTGMQYEQQYPFIIKSSVSKILGRRWPILECLHHSRTAPVGAHQYDRFSDAWSLFFL